MATLKDIFEWFSVGKTPTADQFKNAWSSFWHKSEKINTTQVLGLDDALAAKASTEQLQGVAVGLIYHPAVPTTDDLLTTYPDANKGWAVKVNDDGFIYQFDGKSWNNTGLKSFPDDVATKADLSLKITDAVGAVDYTRLADMKKSFWEGVITLKQRGVGVVSGIYSIVDKSDSQVVLIPATFKLRIGLTDLSGNTIKTDDSAVLLLDKNLSYVAWIGKASSISLSDIISKGAYYAAVEVKDNTDYKQMPIFDPDLQQNAKWDFRFLPNNLISNATPSGNLVQENYADWFCANNYFQYIKGTNKTMSSPFLVDKSRQLKILGDAQLFFMREDGTYVSGEPKASVKGVFDLPNMSDIQSEINPLYALLLDATTNSRKFYASQDETVEEISTHGYKPYWTAKVSDFSKSVVEVSTYNLFDKTRASLNTMLHNTGITTTVFGFVTTDYISVGDVSKGATVSCNINPINTCVFFDADKETISSNSDAYSFKPIPESTRYIRLSFSTSQTTDGTGKLSMTMQELIDRLIIVKGSGASGVSYMPTSISALSNDIINKYHMLATRDLRTGYNGLLFDSLGDSITEQRMYQAQVAAYFGVSYFSHGIGGTRLSGTATNSMWQDVRINALHPYADVITIMGGVNDAANYSIGDISLENVDIYTIIGAYNVILSKIFHRYGMLTNNTYTGIQQVERRNVQVVLITPTYVKSLIKDLPKIVDAVINVGRLWNLPVANVFDNSGMGNQTIDIYWDTDKVHPNALGHKQIAKVVIGKLKEIEPIFI